MLNNFYIIAPAVDNGENDPEKLQALVTPIVAMVLAKQSMSSIFTESLNFHDPHVLFIDKKVLEVVVPRMKTMAEKVVALQRQKVDQEFIKVTWPECSSKLLPTGADEIVLKAIAGRKPTTKATTNLCHLLVSLGLDAESADYTLLDHCNSVQLHAARIRVLWSKELVVAEGDIKTFQTSEQLVSLLRCLKVEMGYAHEHISKVKELHGPQDAWDAMVDIIKEASAFLEESIDNLHTRLKSVVVCATKVIKPTIPSWRDYSPKNEDIQKIKAHLIDSKCNGVIADMYSVAKYVQTEARSHVLYFSPNSVKL